MVARACNDISFAKFVIKHNTRYQEKGREGLMIGDELISVQIGMTR